MFGEARLVTPEGKILILTANKYRKIQQVLADRPLSPLRTDQETIRALVHELRGRYAGRSSLTQALLEERQQERLREDAQNIPHA